MDTYQFKAMRTAADKLAEGTDEWLEGMSMRLQMDFGNMETYGAERLVNTLRAIWKHQPWETIPLNHPSKRSDIYIEGITGQPWSVLEQVVRGFDKQLADLILSEVNPGEVGGDGSNQHSKHDNIMIATPSQGTSKSYTLNRLKRESPELFNAVIAGDLSANKAAIEAGFRKKYYQIEATEESVKAFCKKHSINL